MYKLIRWYNQNRFKFWITVMIIIFIFVIIHLFNSFSEIQIEKQRQEIQQKNNQVQNNNQNSYKNESKSIISGGKVDEAYQKEFGELIDNFLKNCINRNYEEAYKFLSKECKAELYPSKKMFIDNYCNEKFEKDMQYSFQSWTSSGNYIFLIKIYENILSTGNANTNYIQDYYTIKQENDEYKLNISSFIGKQNYASKIGEKNGIKIELKNTCVYMDYQTYEISVKNNTQNSIMLNPKENSNSIYIIDSNGIKIDSLLYENKENELILSPGEEKKITIKFNNAYQYGVNISKIVFSNIITNYEEYLNNNEYEEKEIIEIEI